jgi:ATP-dependent RNA helicase SUPV3L1/SUV3
VVSDRTLKGNYGAVKPGDCVVTFSRKNVFEIGQFIEKVTKQRCAVIYGDLPPGT